MPTYEYQCEACEHAFELFQSMSESKKRKCPSCGKNKLERLIGTGSAVIFKGSGFYETDYRSESYKKQAKADSEPKPAAATEAKAKPADPKPAEPKPTPAKPAADTASKAAPKPADASTKPKK